MECLDLSRAPPRVIQNQGRIIVGIPRDMSRVSLLAIYNEVGVKDGTFTKRKTKENIIKDGLSKVTIREEKMIMKKTTLNRVKVRSLNGVVNSHADAIKLLEDRLSLLSAQLEPSIMKENGARGLVVVTRSGKVVIAEVVDNNEEDKGMEEEEIPIHQSIAKETQKICGET
ncbi:hypothetical protein KY290_024943 [Solanum tuberosum]|uniref:Uncharacterized protein n=1 Tax=Solanum tuberosum TaxID=4113 RepID=A0ABQ7UU54_SOLTU|nr:hypothetical protein KY290_024943 [Solanum tuberosum]